MTHSMLRFAAVPLAALALLVSGCSMMGGRMAMADGPMSREMMMDKMAGWSESSRMAAAEAMAAYGMPDEMTATMATWHNSGPFTRTVVYAEAVPHRFPAPHDDVMEQFVDYRVPPAMFDELAMYDGSVMAARTTGELSARCDKIAFNMLALNLAHEIVTGAMTVEQARTTYAEQVVASKAGQPARYTERLLFTPMPGAADPDSPAPMMGRN